MRRTDTSLPIVLTAGHAGRVTAPNGTAPVDPHQPQPYVHIKTPEWAKSATLYQLNTRQFTPEGTFRAAERQLPRLQALGADIIWLMPIHEIGEKNRKGTLGSPYSVKDYYSVSPEFGAEVDLRSFIDRAHALGMKVILDWVREFDIDGYRCDVAGFVPIDFWDNARRELDAIKPVFMLAEWEMRDMHARAFDMTYAWSWNDAVEKIAQGKADVSKLYLYYSWNEGAYPVEALRMTYTSNHDANAWDGTAAERYGDALPAAIVLSVVGEGMPLIHNGQEAGESKRLKFFERDPIEWQPHPLGDLYASLSALKKRESALWNGKWGARMLHVPNSASRKVLSFVRQDPRSKVFAVINFSAEPQTVTLHDGPFPGRYVEHFSREPVELAAETALDLAPWAYRVYVRP